MARKRRKKRTHVEEEVAVSAAPLGPCAMDILPTRGRGHVEGIQQAIALLSHLRQPR